MRNLVPDTSAPKLQHVIICGGGLAAQMTAGALAYQAPPYIRITWLKGAVSSATDVFYGSVATPSAYDFNLSAGIAEPELVLNSNTAFSYGTQYVDWGIGAASWVQCFHLPLRVLEGVPFQHYLTQQGLYDIEPYLASAVAARRGAFAHPPEGQGHAMSRAEYGYQLDASAYGALFEKSAASRVEIITEGISKVEFGVGEISGIHLTDGQIITADLYVDCSGPQSVLLSQMGVLFTGDRRLVALASHKPSTELGLPVRTITGGEFGWSAETPLQNGIARLTVYDPETEELALQAHGDSSAHRAGVTLGHHETAWSGNCVAIGQAAGVVEPITSAPFILLQRDIERLLALLPITTQMSVERQQFNRQYADDYRHAGLFSRALFEGPAFPDTPYWRAARHEPVDERLAGKIEQFESRGLHVAFDLEPFNHEDWIIMHYGMRRRAARYDRIVDRAPKEKVKQYLANLQRDIDHAVKAMPSHNAYLKGLAKYLKQQSVVMS